MRSRADVSRGRRREELRARRPLFGEPWLVPEQVFESLLFLLLSFAAGRDCAEGMARVAGQSKVEREFKEKRGEPKCRAALKPRLG